MAATRYLRSLIAATVSTKHTALEPKTEPQQQPPTATNVSTKRTPRAVRSSYCAGWPCGLSYICVVFYYKGHSIVHMNFVCSRVVRQYFKTLMEVEFYRGY